MTAPTAPDERPARDRLPRWLFGRYSGRDVDEWDDLGTGERIHWQEEADTVVSAVVRLAQYKIVPR